MKMWLLASALTFSFMATAAPSLAVDDNPPSCNSDHPGRFTTLVVHGREVKTYRDGCGIPHIFADTNHGLFVGYGYAVARDRLWQLELNRRSARGRLSEIF